MNDVLPDAVGVWQFLERSAREVFGTYGFAEIRTPVLEKTELFCRSIGETTDIVEKEMYTFADKSGNSMTLRPEGTAPVMRSIIQNRLAAQDPVAKLFYIGPMFRYERPQKGRYRQFYQIGVEAIGVEDPKIDAQILMMLHHFFNRIGINAVSLEINSLGCPACRPDYRRQLIQYLEQRLEPLCSECQRRYQTNPLRVLDCKVESCRAATTDAPAVVEHLCGECDQHFSQVRHYLDLLKVPYTVNVRMVRGLDYYVRTTFELVTDQLGSQNAVAAGGRYDGLIESLGGPALPGIGFAIGLERLVLMLDQDVVSTAAPELFIAALGDAAVEQAFILMSQLQVQGVRADMDFQGKSLKAQMRRADKLGAVHTLIIGDDELRSGQAQLKKMADGSQTSVRLDALLDLLT
ncbi:histidine--tRNA ligase [Pelovirga terrestris]|nr:histidine--tRNA ligase [Pelovirga terrestris]